MVLKIKIGCFFNMGIFIFLSLFFFVFLIIFFFVFVLFRILVSCKFFLYKMFKNFLENFLSVGYCFNVGCIVIGIIYCLLRIVVELKGFFM